tara:strand:- start:3575 stop:4753 length:1179 start_codon:yes stop_codon:yes gene_type:complete
MEKEKLKTMHGISVNADGVYEMASGNGITPWHRLGQVVDGLMTSQECMEAANLDWIVRTTEVKAEAPIFARTPTGNIRRKTDPETGVMNPVIEGYQEIPGLETTFVTYREDKNGGNVKALTRGKAVGKVYTPFQNHDAFAFLDELVQSQEANFECAGALGNGEKVWMLMKVPHEITVGEKDTSQLYILLTNTHDGTGAIKVMPTSVRVVCQNTLSMALGGARAENEIFNIRHTSQAANRVDDAREALQMGIDWHKKLGEQMNELVVTKMTKKEMDEFFIQALKLTYHPDWEINEKGRKVRHPKAGKLVSASARTLKELNSMKKRATNTVGEMKGTAYQALNVLTEYVDHEKRLIRTGKNAGKANIKRDESAAFRDGRVIKTKAHQLLVEMYL